MDSKSNKWFVSYKVPALTGDKLHIVGPYTEDAAQYHASDIYGYEGTSQVQIYQENADELLDAKLTPAS